MTPLERSSLMSSHVERRACGSRPGRGLVEEHQLGAPDDRHGKAESLLLAAGEPAVGRASVRLHAEPFDQQVDVERVGVKRGDVPQHLVGAGAGPGSAGLQHDADAGSELVGVGDRVEAEHAYGSALRAAKALTGLDRGGLAGAVGAEDRGDGAGVDREVEPVDGGDRSVLHDEVLTSTAG